MKLERLAREYWDKKGYDPKGITEKEIVYHLNRFTEQLLSMKFNKSGEPVLRNEDGEHYFETEHGDYFLEPGQIHEYKSIKELWEENDKKQESINLVVAEKKSALEEIETLTQNSIENEKIIQEKEKEIERLKAENQDLTMHRIYSEMDAESFREKFYKKGGVTVEPDTSEIEMLAEFLRGHVDQLQQKEKELEDMREGVYNYTDALKELIKVQKDDGENVGALKVIVLHFEQLLKKTDDE